MAEQDHSYTTTPNTAETALGMSTPETDKNGNREWRNSEGLLHREDGPAYEGANNIRMWYQNGQLHREDGPAIEWLDGTRSWYLNGQRHRTDGPAVEDDSGYRAWVWHGEELTFAEWLDKAATAQQQTLLRLRWSS
jgi:hypothetical protein